MATLILTFLISLLAILGLAIGVIAGRAPLKGSCGGLACHKGIGCGTCRLKQRKEGP
ncbi:MAG: hypothetical protein HKO95_18475 [Rhodobacteraceae bacterium]|jgi:hypothetical protein|nr:hypothetical protein [Alphaproteobacteria bacterium]MBT8475514.1 hypothetical protein [Alphaproteobacteria bacterium]NNF72160.1 hypothetical protein [Paracoccaceae bacterium]NNK68715.1 hypothetical protein [Paracoccaceae bacterium]